jgi:hypothetical protein
VLEAGHQRHVLHGSGGLERVHQIGHGEAVDADVLRLGLHAHPRGDEDRFGADLGDGGEGLRIQEVRGERHDSGKLHG